MYGTYDTVTSLNGITLGLLDATQEIAYMSMEERRREL